jgi:hypothetical protein
MRGLRKTNPRRAHSILRHVWSSPLRRMRNHRTMFHMRRTMGIRNRPREHGSRRRIAKTEKMRVLRGISPLVLGSSPTGSAKDKPVAIFTLSYGDGAFREKLKRMDLRVVVNAPRKKVTTTSVSTRPIKPCTAHEKTIGGRG